MKEGAWKELQESELSAAGHTWWMQLPQALLPPQAPAAGTLGRGDAETPAAGACTQTASKGLPQGAAQPGNSFENCDIKPKQNLVTSHQSMAPQFKWWGSVHDTQPEGSVSLSPTL